MKRINVNHSLKMILDPKKGGLKARLFVTREDGISVYDSVQDSSSSSVAALVSGLWQASDALMNLVDPKSENEDFRLGFDTSARGIFLMPLVIDEQKYFLGAIYHDCLNPGQLKRQIAMIKQEVEMLLEVGEEVKEKVATKNNSFRTGYLFSEITDEEIDRLFSVSGI